MAPGTRNTFGAPKSEPEVFRKQMYCFENSAYHIVVTFWLPAVIGRPVNYGPLPPSLRLWCYVIKIGKFFGKENIFKSERHELLFHEHLQLSNTIRHGSCTNRQQRLLAAFQASSCSFLSLLCLPDAFFSAWTCLFC